MPAMNVKHIIAADMSQNTVCESVGSYNARQTDDGPIPSDTTTAVYGEKARYRFTKIVYLGKSNHDTIRPTYFNVIN